ncbi:MAG: hypothetical protein QOK30_148 [Nocardioidaceae bacterium]|jgi:heme A synthase|nr:hypothetical protein [Nocardioidaceae bacterium]
MTTANLTATRPMLWKTMRLIGPGSDCPSWPCQASWWRWMQCAEPGLAEVQPVPVPH